MLDSERRNDSRRTNDTIDVSEVLLLRQGLENLQDKFESQERADRKRLLALEIEVAEFRRKFNVGRGFLYGAVAALGAFGILLVDRIKELINLIKQVV